MIRDTDSKKVEREAHLTQIGRGCALAYVGFRRRCHIESSPRRGAPSAIFPRILWNTGELRDIVFHSHTSGPAAWAVIFSCSSKLVIVRGSFIVITAEETFNGTWLYAPCFSQASGFKQHYVDEGPREGEVILCLHGKLSLEGDMGLAMRLAGVLS